MTSGTGAVRIWHDDAGPRDAPAVLLVMGQGADATAWDDDVLGALLGAGYRIVRVDNRDSGLSSDSDRYTVVDMAGDAVTVLDTVGIEAAHVVGQSMGGMIAQQLAIDSPARVASLALLSTSPDLSIAPSDDAVLRAAADLRVSTCEAWIEAAVGSARLQTGSRWAFDEGLVRSRITACVERAFRPGGALRQVDAILRSPARTEALRAVTVPTLIVHGSEDPILPVPHATALAEAIPHADLVIVEGMGHVVPWGHWDVVLDPLLEHLGRATPPGSAS